MMKTVKILFRGNEFEIPEDDKDFFIKEKGAKLVSEKAPEKSTEDKKTNNKETK